MGNRSRKRVALDSFDRRLTFLSAAFAISKVFLFFTFLHVPTPFFLMDDVLLSKDAIIEILSELEYFIYFHFI